MQETNKSIKEDPIINVRFKVKNEYNNFVKKIFNNIDIKKYNWEIEDSEVYGFEEDGTFGKDIFNQNIMTGKEFEADANNEKYYMIFLTAIAFDKTDEIVEVNNYADFVNSNAKIAIICVDTEYIDVFSKDESILKQIINNCKEKKFNDIEIINQEKDVIDKFV